MHSNGLAPVSVYWRRNKSVNINRQPVCSAALTIRSLCGPQTLFKADQTWHWVWQTALQAKEKLTWLHTLSPEMHFDLDNKVVSELLNKQLLFILNSCPFQVIVGKRLCINICMNQWHIIQPLTWPSLPSRCRPSAGCRDTTSALESRADHCWWSGTPTGRWGWAGPWGSTGADPLRGAGGGMKRD